MRERDFQTKFTTWLKYNSSKSSVYELKLCKGKSMPFDAVMPHQITSLKLAKSRKLIHKIADVGMLQKPFDCFVVVNCDAYVVIMFYRHGQKEFIMIDVDDFIKEKETSDRKSLTEERAKEIGVIYSLS